MNFVFSGGQPLNLHVGWNEHTMPDVARPTDGSCMTADTSSSNPHAKVAAEALEAALNAGFNRSSRTIPVPTTVSRTAQEWLVLYHRQSWLESALKFLPSEMQPKEGRLRLSLEAFRTMGSGMRALAFEASKALYPVNVEEGEIAGVPVFVVTPVDETPRRNAGRVLVNTPGNGFVLPVLTPIEAAPIANMLRVKVVTVRPRLAPEHPFPAAVDDVVAVVKRLSDSYDPNAMGIFGSSSGGLLAAQSVAKLVHSGLSTTGALGILSSSGDMYTIGDTHYTNADIDGSSDFLTGVELPPFYYSGSTPLVDPVLSPILSDLSRFPTTLIMSGTRDHMLSGSVLMHRALRRAKVQADLHVFEAMPHAHWYFGYLPESREAHEVVAEFFDRTLV